MNRKTFAPPVQLTSFDNIDPEWAWSDFVPSEEEPWDIRRVSHLYRRAGFGLSPRQLKGAVEAGIDTCIDQLFSTVPDDEYRQTYAALEAAVGPRRAPEPNVALWLYAMLHSPDQLLEKTTLFWHGHFATSAAKVTNPRLMLDQNQLLRRLAFGPFEELVKAISRDPAMLIYLDSTDNRKTHPNENYARELMELFCLGVGNYTEQDIQEVARCFTGWEVRREQFRFNRYQHDFGIKQVLNQSGEFDGDDAIAIILEQPAAAEFMATKLLRFFLADQDPFPARIVAPLAAHIHAQNFETNRILRKLFASNLFYSTASMAGKIRSPLELVVGTMRQFEASGNLYELATLLNSMGQRPLYPPNVKGWDGGRDWINSSTQLTRINFMHRLANQESLKFKHESLSAWLESSSSAFGITDIEEPHETVDFLLQQLLAVDLDQSRRDMMIELASAKAGNREEQLTFLVSSIGALPEFQLG